MKLVKSFQSRDLNTLNKLVNKWLVDIRFSDEGIKNFIKVINITHESIKMYGSSNVVYYNYLCHIVYEVHDSKHYIESLIK